MSEKNKSARRGKRVEQFWFPEDLSDELRAYAETSKIDKTEIAIIALRKQMAEGVRETLASRLDAVKKLSSSTAEDIAGKKAEFRQELDQNKKAARSRKKSDTRQGSSSIEGQPEAR